MRTKAISTIFFFGLAAMVLSACKDDEKNDPYHDASVMEDGSTTDSAADSGIDAETDGGVDPRFEPLIQSIRQEQAAFEASGVAIAVMEQGQVTLALGFGTRSPDGTDPVLPTTLFRIGSVTKMLTAAGLLRLVDQQEVDLDQPITTYLPGFSFTMDASWTPSIRVEDLLTHSSAVVDEMSIEADPPYDDDSGLSAFAHGPFEDAGYLMAPVGRMYNYTNPGYSLAALVAETASAVFYRLLVTDTVLLPLGMTRTYFLPEDVLADGDYACGSSYHWETGLPIIVEPDTYDNPFGRPAGYAFSSVLDLARFVGFLRDGDEEVLSDELRISMQDRHVNTEQALDLIHYGYGLSIQDGIFLPGDQTNDFYDIKIVSHDGAISGFSSEVFFVPELDFAFITLANTDGAYFHKSFLVGLATLCSLPAPSTPPDLALDPASLDVFAGEYNDPFLVGQILVTRDGDDLEVEMPLLDIEGIPYSRDLVYLTPNNFLIHVAGHQFMATFILNGEGEAEYIRTRPMVGSRASGKAPLAAALFRPDPKRLLRMFRSLPPPPLLLQPFFD